MKINDLKQDRAILVAKGAEQAEQEKQSCKHTKLACNTL